jgi:hypothetical protein
MPVTGNGGGKIREAPVISVDRVLKVVSTSKYRIETGRERYDRLETDGFYTYVGNKKNRLRLIYARRRETGKIVAYVRGNRDPKRREDRENG